MWNCFTDCFTVLQYKIHPDHFYSFNKLVCYSTLLVIKYFLLYPYQWLINIHKVTVPVKLTVRGYRTMNHMCFIQYINGISENIFIQCCLYIWSICVIMKHCTVFSHRYGNITGPHKHRIWKKMTFFLSLAGTHIILDPYIILIYFCFPTHSNKVQHRLFYE